MQSFYGSAAVSSFCKPNADDGIDLPGIGEEQGAVKPLQSFTSLARKGTVLVNGDRRQVQVWNDPARTGQDVSEDAWNLPAPTAAHESAENHWGSEGPVEKDVLWTANDDRPWAAAAAADADAYIAKACGYNSNGDARRTSRSVFPAGAANLDLRTCSFSDWLASVAPTESLMQYVSVLEENYDTVAQITRTYVVEGRGGKELNTQFFDDVRVVDPGHRRLFHKWFESVCGVRQVDADR